MSSSLGWCTLQGTASRGGLKTIRTVSRKLILLITVIINYLSTLLSDPSKQSAACAALRNGLLARSSWNGQNACFKSFSICKWWLKLWQGWKSTASKNEKIVNTSTWLLCENKQLLQWWPSVRKACKFYSKLCWSRILIWDRRSLKMSNLWH